MKFKVEIEREEDGRWIAEVNELPGVLVYGDSVEQAQAKAQALALRVLADRLENGEAAPFESVSFGRGMSKIVEDAITLYKADGKPLPPATSGRDCANKVQHVA